MESLDHLRKKLSTAKPLFTQIQRFNHTGQLRSKTSKASRTLPQLLKVGSLDNGKQNLSYENFLQKVTSAKKIDQTSVVSSYLKNLRQNYDNMVRQTKKMQSKISTLKKQMEFTKQKVQINYTQSHKSEKNKKILEQHVKDVKSKHQNVEMQTKILYHMINRMKNDQLFYKSSLTQKQAALSQKHKAVKQKKQEILQWEQVIHKIQTSYQKLQKQLEENKVSRELKYLNYHENVSCLQDKQRFVQERQQRTFQLLNIQSNDILDSKNIVVRNILLVNKLADNLLEHRINKLLKKYESTQNAFHTIKTKTSLADPTSLASKFFSYGQLAENLMKSIGSLERQQQHLKQVHDQLQNEYKNLLHKGFESETPKGVENIKTDDLKMKYSLESIQLSMLNQKIKQWIIKKFDLLVNNIDQKFTLSEKFEIFCSKLKQDIDNYSEGNLLTEKKYQTPGFRLKKLIKEVSIEEQTIRKSEMQQMIENNRTENQFLSQSRYLIKKHNQLKSKFV